MGWPIPEAENPRQVIGQVAANVGIAVMQKAAQAGDQIPGDVSEILVIQLLNLLCLTFFSMLVFSNVITSISTMYMSRDLDLLVSSPIPVRDLFLSKYIVTIINSSWMAVLFSMPVFVA